MRLSLRVSGLTAILGAGILLLNAAVPAGIPAKNLGATPVIDPTTGTPLTTPRGEPILSNPVEPPPGAVTSVTAIQELRQVASVDVHRNGTVQTVTAAPGKNLGADRDAFVKRYAGAFGLAKGHTLNPGKAVALPGGDQVVRYQQHAAGLPILGGEIVVTTSADGNVRGAITDTTSLAPATGKVTVSADQARDSGLAAATKQFKLDGAALGTAASLWLYESAGQLRPTYWVKIVEKDGHDHEVATVLIDAIDGSVKLVATEHQSIRNRIVCDAANGYHLDGVRVQYACNEYTTLGQKTTTRREGGSASSIGDVNRAYEGLGAAYKFFKDNFDRDSYDGRGAQLNATVRSCIQGYQCPFPNAWWEGYQFVFGQGFAADDVVAHEFTHAVTENASSLYYWHEAGALNEALSDIFGEFIDLATPGDGSDDTTQKWMLGEGLSIGAIRNMANPNQYGQPATYGGTYWVYDNSDNGGVHSNSGPANRMAAILADGMPSSGIGALGLEKSAKLWYRIMHLLSSGANYTQLVITAKAACRELINKVTTVADCDNVTRAIEVIYPTLRQPYDLCDTSYAHSDGRRPVAFAFTDDFESGPGKWTLSNNFFWQAIPSSQIDYTYAASGRGSLNGWTQPGSGVRGHGTTAEMKDWAFIRPEPELSSYVSFNFSAVQNGIGNEHIGVFASINDGSGWEPFMFYNGGSIMAVTNGYRYIRADLSAFAGKSVKFKFQVHSPNNQFVDWYLDNFSVYTCDKRVPGLPGDAFGYFDGSDLKLTWSRDPLYLPDGQTDDYRFDLTYSPDIPGAPTFVLPTSTGMRHGAIAAGADPTKRYEVTVRIRLANGTLGPPTTIVVNPGPPLSCAIGPSSLSGFAPNRRTPVDACFAPLIPRR